MNRTIRMKPAELKELGKATIGTAPSSTIQIDDKIDRTLKQLQKGIDDLRKECFEMFDALAEMQVIINQMKEAGK